MITCKQIDKTRHDVFGGDGKYIGDLSLGKDGIFHWFPMLSLYRYLDSGTLTSIASKLDRLNAALKNETNSTATD